MRGKVRRTAFLSLLSTIGFLLMFVEIPLPMFPAFLKIGVSEIPALIGAILFGPLAGVAVELIKNILHFLLTNQGGMAVGELSNFVAGSTFVVVSVLLMRKLKQSKVNFWLGMAAGTTAMAIVMTIANYFVFIPAFAYVLGMSVQDIVGWSQEANSRITSLWALVIYAILPFNLIKGLIEAVITYPIYNRLRPVLQGK
ncbi:ECF transporter S component [Aneurinibacillus danicus]|uniref:Riboflavin transporter n=1 Tax=Aneurinibacillus danicus TaxID=267746 RepID=A0A511V549_9BACL|nr:ECF transporter S component [Aneurinibacillus danicus]GEN34056.1 riboflavin transporter [Aneurinibacillus danicus]